MSENRDDKGRFTTGNRANLQHGGEGAVKSIAAGTPMCGLAAAEELQVKADLEDAGTGALVRETAVRLQTATRLYWNAVKSAADAGDLEKLDAYVARFGWLAGAALRAWAQVRKGAPDDRGVVDYEKLLAEQRRRERETDGE